MEAGIGAIITIIVMPLVLLKTYYMHKENKDYRRRLGIKKMRHHK